MIRNKNNIKRSNSAELISSINKKENLTVLLSKVKSYSKNDSIEKFQNKVIVSHFLNDNDLPKTGFKSISSSSIALQKLFGCQKSVTNSSSGLVVGYGGNLKIKSGGLACNYVIVENGLLSVQKEGKASEILITRDGMMVIEPDGLAMSSQVMSFGLIKVNEKGVLIQPLIAKNGELIAGSDAKLLEPLFANGAKINLNTDVTIWRGKNNETDHHFYISHVDKLIETLAKTDLHFKQFVIDKKANQRCAYHFTISHPESKLEVLTNHYSFKTKVTDGIEAVFGESHESTVSHLGQQIIYAEGLSSCARVEKNGKLILLDKGKAKNLVVQSQGLLEAESTALIDSPRLENDCILRLSTHATINNGHYLAKPLETNSNFLSYLIDSEKTTQNDLVNQIFSQHMTTFKISHIGKTKLASNIVLSSPKAKLIVQPGHASEHTHIYAGKEKVLGISNYTKLLGPLAVQTVYGTAYTSLIDSGATLSIQKGGIVRHAKIHRGKLIQHENSVVDSAVIKEEACLICLSSSAKANHINLQNSSIVMGELNDDSFQALPPLAYEIDSLVGSGKLIVRWDVNTGKCDCIVIDNAQGHFELVIRTTGVLPKKINVQQFIICRQGDASFSINSKN